MENRQWNCSLWLLKIAWRVKTTVTVAVIKKALVFGKVVKML